MNDQHKTKAQLIDELEQTRKRVAELEQSEEELLKRTHNLSERIKELNCLLGISTLVETREISFKEIYKGVVYLIPPSWQYPEITCA